MISSQTRKNDVFAKFQGEEANANHILYGYNVLSKTSHRQLDFV